MLTRSPAKTSRRLPGLRFEVQTPPLADVLPRMDVAALVGFAASGPLHVPVVVEDEAQFASIFGEDAPLAWDAVRGETRCAYLGPAVRAFFRNGGKRCWVVRVAGEARANRFPLPGMAVRTADPAQPLVQAAALARSEGSWADGLRAAASLQARPTALQPVSLADLTFDLPGGSAAEVGVGDLLRLSFASGDRLFFRVGALHQEDSGHNPGHAAVPPRLTGGSPAWFRIPGAMDDGLTPDAAWDVSGSAPAPVALSALPLRVLADGSVQVGLNGVLADAPLPGTLLRITVGARDLYLTVLAARALPGQGFSGETVLVSGAGLWRAVQPPDPLPVEAALAEVLTLELWVRAGEMQPQHLSGLGFCPGHPNFWCDLPLDAALYDPHPLVPRRAPSDLWDRAAGWDAAGGQLAGQSARFPLAGSAPGPADAGLYCLPLGMSVLPEPYRSPAAQAETPLERDGLAEYSAGLFLDPDLAAQALGDLLNAADYIRYQSPAPRALRGIHAVLGIEEVTLVAVPDAVQPGWVRSDPPAALAEVGFAPELHPEWWHDLPCSPPEELPRAENPPRDLFQAVDLPVLPAVRLEATTPDWGGAFRLAWSLPDGVDLPVSARWVYSLEEAAAADFQAAELLYQGRDTTQSIYSRSPGVYYYRVRVEMDWAPDGALVRGDWSNGVGVRVALAERWQVRPEADGQVDGLLAVQRGLLRMCAARGDLFAVLALPAHFNEDAAVQYAGRLRSGADAALPVGTGLSLPISGTEQKSLSYAALYHPWLLANDRPSGAAVRLAPPEGAVLGLHSQRALERGAWVAAANIPLLGPVALSPAMSAGRRLDLQDARVNLVRRASDGYRILDSSTLSLDPDLVEINVRRLLSLLRRLALREGARYVFEPNDLPFQRMVQRGFESWLMNLFGRGAFAGRTPGESFQVQVTSTPQDIDAGRFIIELRVAPAVPLRFLTIRLVQSGEHGQVQEGRL
jgi:hypothetical protein